MLTAANWRGQAVEPQVLLSKYNLRIQPVVSRAWRIVALWETHGRPELRQVVEGTQDSVTFSAISNAGLRFENLKSEMKAEGNVLNFNVSASSYYQPRLELGPWTVAVNNGQPSESIQGLGLAVDPVGDNPTGEEDSRYLTCAVVWMLTDSGSGPPVTPPPVEPPPVTPLPPVPPPVIDLPSLQAYIRTLVREEVQAKFDRIKGVL